MEYHVPVMLRECIEGLNIKSDGVYVDVTFGAGGHSKSILKNLGANGRLFGFDQDEDAEANTLKDDRFTFVRSNFKYLDQFMEYYNIPKVDGILADLGVSSHQINEADRGFSYRFEGPIDMRMNRFVTKNAGDLLNEYSYEDLLRIFSDYGQIRNSKTLAATIVEERQKQSFETMSHLVRILNSKVMGNRAKYLAQVFQALRIELNDEMGVLDAFLDSAMKRLAKGGRLVVMSYHSLEDRLVKNYIKTGNAKGQMIKDDFGNIDRPFKSISKGVVMASEEELKVNNRARSARLRIAEKQY